MGPLVYSGEFGYELQSMVPYAHYLHENCYEIETVSTPDTEALYYFSDNHTIAGIRGQKNRMGCCPVRRPTSVVGREARADVL